MIEALFTDEVKSPWDEQVVAAMYLLGADAEKVAISEDQKAYVRTFIKLLRELPPDSARELALEILIQGAANKETLNLCAVGE